MLVQDPETGTVYWREDGKLTEVLPDDIAAFQGLQRQTETAKSVDPYHAGALKMADRVANILRKVGIDDEAMGIKPGAIDELEIAHPTATAIGNMVPYVPAAVGAVASGGVLPALGATLLGVGGAGLLADEGEVLRDMAISAIPAAKIGGARLGAKALGAGAKEFKGLSEAVKLGKKAAGSKGTSKAIESTLKTKKWVDRATKGVDYGERTARGAALTIPGLLDTFAD